MNSDLLFDRSYVNGAWTNHGLGSFEVSNPANGKVLATVLDGGKEIIEQAIVSANAAFKPWSSSTAKHRASILENWNSLILKNTDDLATIMTLECGKPLKESKGEVAYGAFFH